MRRNWVAGIAITLCFSAATANEDAAEYRHVVMEAVGGHMRAIGEILRGNVSHSDHLALHANALADLASIASELFPPGSQGGEALDAIWENPADFAEKIAAFESATQELKAATESGDSAAIGGAVRNVGRSCKGCHDSYRE